MVVRVVGCGLLWVMVVMVYGGELCHSSFWIGGTGTGETAGIQTIQVGRTLEYTNTYSKQATIGRCGLTISNVVSFTNQ